MAQKRILIGSLFVVLVVTAALTLKTTHVVRADDAPAKITIDMEDFHFTVEGQQPSTPILLKVGQLYDMTIKNTGKYAHEIWWGRDPRMVEDEGRLDGYKTNLLENVAVAITGTQPNSTDPFEIDINGLVEIEEAPGQQFTIEFKLPDSAKGQWEIGCFQPMPKATETAPATDTPAPDVPHYTVGMKLDLIVQ